MGVALDDLDQSAPRLANDFHSVAYRKASRRAATTSVAAGERIEYLIDAAEVASPTSPEEQRHNGAAAFRTLCRVEVRRCGP